MTSSLTAHQLLEKLALREVTNASFPTHFMIILKLRTAMGDKSAPHKKIVQMMNGEPVISARLIQAANAVAHYGNPVTADVSTAVSVLGTATVRRIALGVAMSQLAKSKDLLVFSSLSRTLWLHSIQTASTASLLARTLTTLPSEEAFFAGLMINMGAFYLLYQASQNKLLQRSPDDVANAIKQFYPVMTKKVLAYLGLPAQVIDAVDLSSFENLRLSDPPKSMAQVVQAAMVMSMNDHPWYLDYTRDSLLSNMYTDLNRKALESLEEVHEQYR